MSFSAKDPVFCSNLAHFSEIQLVCDWVTDPSVICFELDHYKSIEKQVRKMAEEEILHSFKKSLTEYK